MAWGKKDEELPESLRGKTPEQVAAELKEAADLKAKLVDLETKQNESNSRFETFKGQLDTMNTNLTTLVGKLNAPPKTDDKPREMADFITEPDRAFAERAAPLVGLQLQTAAVLARNSALDRARSRQQQKPGNIDGRLFEKFGAEIDELARGVPAAQLANPDTWDHLFYNIKGRHGDEIAESNRERKGDFFIEPTTTSTNKDVQQSEKLTPLEEKIALKTGTTPEKYLEQKKKMVTGVPVEMIP